MLTDELIHYQWETRPMFEQWERSYDISPEERLWKTVLIIYLQDIQKYYLLYKNSLNGVKGEYHENLKLLIEFSKAEWTETICEFAGVDYDTFTDTVRQIITGEKEVKLSKTFQY